MFVGYVTVKVLPLNYLCTLFFLNFIFFFLTTVLSYWEFSRGKFGLLSPGIENCDRVVLPDLCTLGRLPVKVSQEVQVTSVS